MVVITIAIGMAVALAVLMEGIVSVVRLIVEGLNLNPIWYPILLVGFFAFGVGLVFIGIARASKLRPEEKGIGLILPKGFQSAEPNFWRRLWRWLKEN